MEANVLKRNPNTSTTKKKKKKKNQERLPNHYGKKVCENFRQPMEMVERENYFQCSAE